jgi:putative oxidoreductase
MSTQRDISLLILRVTAAVVMFPHGAQLLLGWFGGPGFSGAIQMFGHMHVPALFAFLAICTEFFTPLLLILGVLTRLAALGYAFTMIVAALTVHIANGFFMNWFGQQKGEGVEYHLLAIGITLALVVSGAGRWSLDALIARTLSKRSNAEGGRVSYAHARSAMSRNQ